MNENLGQAQPGEHELYEIRLRGRLDEHWSEWLGGLTMTYDKHDNTILTGPVADQSALHGLLKKVRDLGLPLIAVNRIKLNANGEL